MTDEEMIELGIKGLELYIKRYLQKRWAVYSYISYFVKKFNKISDDVYNDLLHEINCINDIHCKYAPVSTSKNECSATKKVNKIADKVNKSINNFKDAVLESDHYLNLKNRVNEGFTKNGYSNIALDAIASRAYNLNASGILFSKQWIPRIASHVVYDAAWEKIVTDFDVHIAPVIYIDKDFSSWEDYKAYEDKVMNFIENSPSAFMNDFYDLLHTGGAEFSGTSKDTKIDKLQEKLDNNIDSFNERHKHYSIIEVGASPLPSGSGRKPTAVGPNLRKIYDECNDLWSSNAIIYCATPDKINYFKDLFHTVSEKIVKYNDNCLIAPYRYWKPVTNTYQLNFYNTDSQFDSVWRVSYKMNEPQNLVEKLTVETNDGNRDYSAFKPGDNILTDNLNNYTVGNVLICGTDVEYYLKTSHTQEAYKAFGAKLNGKDLKGNPFDKERTYIIHPNDNMKYTHYFQNSLLLKIHVPNTFENRAAYMITPYLNEVWDPDSDKVGITLKITKYDSLNGYTFPNIDWYNDLNFYVNHLNGGYLEKNSSSQIPEYRWICSHSVFIDKNMPGNATEENCYYSFASELLKRLQYDYKNNKFRTRDISIYDTDYEYEDEDLRKFFDIEYENLDPHNDDEEDDPAFEPDPKWISSYAS